MGIFEISLTIWIVQLACYPLHQIIGTLRHEGAHALMAMAEGFEITEFCVLPERHEGRWYWGRVTWRAKLPYTIDHHPPMVSKHVYLAPYYVNILLLIAGVLSIVYLDFWNQWGLSTMFIGTVVSPIVDTAYNVAKFYLKGSGDFAKVFGRKDGHRNP